MISVVALGIVSAGPQVLMQVSRKGINLTLYLFPVSVTEQIRNVTVDGGFGAWSGWSSCSHNDGGIAGSCLCRTRACDHPAPQCGGQQCIGISVEVANCSRETLVAPLKTLPLSASGFEYVCWTVSLRRKETGLIGKR